MKVHFLGLICLATMFGFTSCKRGSSTGAPSVSIEECTTLAPGDLRIVKQRFKATPKPDEVGIFRCRKEDRLNPGMSLAMDQIYWANGKEVHEDLLIAPLSFFEGSAKRPDMPAYRESWQLSAGNFQKDIPEYALLESSRHSAGGKAEQEWIYTKDLGKRTEDLVFTFEMFVMSLEDAKKLHPELKADTDKGTTSWKAAFLTP